MAKIQRCTMTSRKIIFAPSSSPVTPSIEMKPTSCPLRLFNSSTICTQACFLSLSCTKATKFPRANTKIDFGQDFNDSYLAKIKRFDNQIEAFLILVSNSDFYTFSYHMFNCATVDPNATQVKGNMMRGAKNPYLKASDWGWQIDTDGLR